MFESKTERLARMLMREGLDFKYSRDIGALFSRSEKNDKTALLHLYQFNGRELTEAWSEYLETAKRKTKPTLQRLYKLMKTR